MRQKFEKATTNVSIVGWRAASALEIFALAILLAMSGCATRVTPPPRAVTTAPPPQPTKRSANVVKASWYGAEFAGHTTTSGERFDPNRMTAASKTLPLGSLVKVENPRNGRSVTVRINDCGPYVRGRSLDLSKGAAQKIGMTHDGTARVKLTTLETPRDGVSCAR
jgi:rare lipoprotein A